MRARAELDFATPLAPFSARAPHHRRGAGARGVEAARANKSPPAPARAGCSVTDILIQRQPARRGRPMSAKNYILAGRRANGLFVRPTRPAGQPQWSARVLVRPPLGRPAAAAAVAANNARRRQQYCAGAGQKSNQSHVTLHEPGALTVRAAPVSRQSSERKSSHSSSKLAPTRPQPAARRTTMNNDI